MFDRIKAEFYVMVDGDDTYPAEHVRKLLEPVLSENADMVFGARLSNHTGGSFRSFHVFGNNLVRKLVNWLRDPRVTEGNFRSLSFPLGKADSKRIRSGKYF